MKRLHSALAITAATLGAGAAVTELLPDRNPAGLAEEIEKGVDHISAVDLAKRIMQGDRSLLIYDLRTPAEFDWFHIPGAKNTTVRDLSQSALPRDSTIVLYSEGGAHAAQAWVLLRMRGYQKAFFLREGIYEWISRVFEPKLAMDANAVERREFQRAAKLSRFFGGIPTADVSRSEVPGGYWTGLSQDSTQAPAALRAASGKRRGC